MKHRNFFFAIFLIVSLLFVTIISYNATDSESLIVFDYHSKKEYSVSYAEGSVQIARSDKSISFPYETDVFSSMVYNGVFAFICKDSLSSYDSASLSVTVFDSETRYLYSVLSPIGINTAPTLFASDDDYNVYMCPKDNTDILLKFSPDTGYTSYDLSSSIQQIMCIDNQILLITADGVFTLADGSPQKLCSIVINTPCTMDDDNEFTSADGRQYCFENNSLAEISESTPVATESTSESISENENYGVKIENDYIYADYGTTVAKLRKALGLKSEDIVVIKTDGKIITSGKLGTGMRALLNSGEKLIVIKGELTGEGNINSRDLKLMMKILTEEKIPNELLKIAADLDDNGEINTKDLFYLSKLY